jgi:hypothetical protein
MSNLQREFVYLTIEGPTPQVIERLGERLKYLSDLILEMKGSENVNLQ